MSLLTIAFLYFFVPQEIRLQALNTVDSHASAPILHAPEDIDSMDRVIFDLDLSWSDSNRIEIPVYIESDDVINTLDFSMLINLANLEFESVVDHTGELQYAAFLNPNDLKLRFTSNSFTPYPVFPRKVVSVRFKVLSGTVSKSDFQMLVAYLNGESCSVEVKGEQFILSSDKAVVHESFITPNPASDFIIVQTEGAGLLDVFDLQGRALIHSLSIAPDGMKHIDVQEWPRGNYTVRLVSKNHDVKIQTIVLQ